MIENQPLVSVNLTTYNRAHILPRALDSIQAQTYQDLEIIVVDDCSSDNTAEVVKRYQEQDARITYIRHEENKKLAHARNTAWKASNGKYIATMDDDDRWVDDGKIYKQVNIFEKLKTSNIAVVCSSVRIYHDENNFKDQYIQKPRNLKYAILIGNGIIHTSTVLIRRDILEKTGGFDENMPRGVDSEFYRTCIIKYGYDVYFMSDITTAYSGYGDDRITPIVGKSAVWKTIYANCYLVKKYLINYLLSPVAFSKRLKTILFLLVGQLKSNLYGHETFNKPKDSRI